MKRMVADPLHPGIASLFYRSGAAGLLRQKLPAPAKFAELRNAARRLLQAGVIDFDRHDAICQAINRRAAAHLLRALRKAEPFGSRQTNIRKLRGLAPLGVSSFAVRMGRNCHV